MSHRKFGKKDEDDDLDDDDKTAETLESDDYPESLCSVCIQSPNICLFVSQWYKFNQSLVTLLETHTYVNVHTPQPVSACVCVCVIRDYKGNVHTQMAFDPSEISMFCVIERRSVSVPFFWGTKSHGHVPAASCHRAAVLELINTPG